jgi:hypothetical protein
MGARRRPALDPGCLVSWSLFHSDELGAKRALFFVSSDHIMLLCNAWLFPGICMDRTEVVGFSELFQTRISYALGGPVKSSLGILYTSAFRLIFLSMLQRNTTRGKMMTAFRNTASDWFDNSATPDWTKRIGTQLRAVLKAFETGLAASHDYRMLAVQQSPEAASRIVFEKHFSK